MQRAEGRRRCSSADVEEREVILVMENRRSLRISHGEDGYRRRKRRKKGF